MFLRFLQKSGFLIILILSLGALYLFVIKEKSCDSPIQYKIGSFDERFGISQKDFLKDIDKAGEIWGESIGKNLFEYNPKGNLTIYLMYDNRQKTTQRNAVLKADADKIAHLANSVKVEYFSLEKDYTLLKQQYNDKLNLFNQNKERYSSQVDYWNSKNGAPKDEYDKLMIEKQNLQNEQAILEQKATEIDSLVTQINEFIQKYNLLVHSANSNINTINLTAGKEFEEGLYDPNKNEIYIYEFSNNQKLIRVLAHELGHALSLEHNTNPKSIMYELNTSSNMTLSKDDLQSLKIRCKL